MNAYAAIRCCARCGGNHRRMVFKPLTRPVVLDADNQPVTVATHWAPCPKSKEPILLLVLP